MTVNLELIVKNYLRIGISSMHIAKNATLVQVLLTALLERIEQHSKII